MSHPVKGTRPYRSRRRAEQARETEARIIEAATALFVERGYGSTTVADVAEAAGVAPQTVHAVFGTKREILRRAVDASIVGDTDLVPLAQRPDVEAVRSAPDARSKMAASARLSRHIMERSAALQSAGRAAAATDPEIRAMWETGKARRLADLSRAGADLWATGELRPELGPEGTTDALWVMTGPEVYELLTIDRGWSADRYEAWLTDALARLLLP